MTNTILINKYYLPNRLENIYSITSIDMAMCLMKMSIGGVHKHLLY